MRKTFLVICLLAVLVGVSCRPTDTVIPKTSISPTRAVSPLPTSIGPQVVPETSGSPVSTPIAASGIHLTATIGPTCPGPERPGQVCTKPYEGLFVVTNGSGAEVARVTTDQDGQATINLPPGDYIVAPKVEGKLPSGTPTSATVIAGQYVEVSIELDSGIR